MRIPENLIAVMDRIVVLMHKEDVLLMPAKRLYRITNGLFQEPTSFDGFLRLLEHDNRFLVLSPHSQEDFKQRMMTEDELETIGYDNGPKVMIRSRMPERHEMLDLLIDKADKTYDSLKHAWDIRPDDDLETEDRLLSALAKAQRLQRELRLLSHELERSRESIEYT